MSTILQRIRNRSTARLMRKTKSPALEGAPFAKGVVSARKQARSKYGNKKEIKA